MKGKILSVAALAAVSAMALTSCSDDSHVIKFYTSMGDNLQKVAQAAIDSFESKNPEWEIQLVANGGYEDVKKAVTADLQAGTQPAIAYAYPDHVADYIPTGKVLDMNKFINDPEVGYTEEEVADFVQSYWNESKNSFGPEYEDQMLTIPFSKSTDAMYVNMTALKNIWSEDKIAKVQERGFFTWDEVWEVADACKAASKYATWTPVGLDSEANWIITQDVQASIPYTTNENITKPEDHYVFNNAENIKFLNDMKVKRDQGKLTTKGLQGGYTSDLFKKGTAGSKEGAIFSLGSTGGANNQDPKGGFEYAVFPYPQISEDKSMMKSVTQGPSLVMFSQNDEEKEKMAWLFVKELLDADFQAKFSKASGYMPVNTKALENEEYAAWLEEGDNIISQTVAVALENVDSYFASPVFKGSSKARDEIGNAVIAALSGSKTAEAALKDAYDMCIF